MRTLWPLMVRRIVGQSMSPTLNAGDIVIGYRWRRTHGTNTVVIAVMDREVIKRIHAVTLGGITLLGDNLNLSTDSRQKGLVQPGSIRAIVIWPRNL